MDGQNKQQAKQDRHLWCCGHGLLQPFTGADIYTYLPARLPPPSGIGFPTLPPHHHQFPASSPSGFLGAGNSDRTGIWVVVVDKLLLGGQ